MPLQYTESHSKTFHNSLPYTGCDSLRALENFQISDLRIHPALITAYAEIKKAAAWANVQTGKLEQKIGDAIIQSADEIIGGQWCALSAWGFSYLKYRWAELQ